MTILYDTRRPVKPARLFGLGLADEPAPITFDDDDEVIVLEPVKTIEEWEAEEAARDDEPKPARRPHDSEPYTGDDRLWWAEHADDASDIDRRAHESYATDALCLGLIPRDLAEGLMAASLVGHPE
jgi:hypothetical protein